MGSFYFVDLKNDAYPNIDNIDKMIEINVYNAYAVYQH